MFIRTPLLAIFKYGKQFLILHSFPSRPLHDEVTTTWRKEFKNNFSAQLIEPGIVYYADLGGNAEIRIVPDPGVSQPSTSISDDVDHPGKHGGSH